jgi:predicted enzyme related to lactoylglutathione lyase
MNEKMSPETNAINWFEIPVTDIARAKNSMKLFLKSKWKKWRCPA